MREEEEEEEKSATTKKTAEFSFKSPSRSPCCRRSHVLTVTSVLDVSNLSLWVCVSAREPRRVCLQVLSAAAGCALFGTKWRSRRPQKKWDFYFLTVFISVDPAAFVILLTWSLKQGGGRRSGFVLVWWWWRWWWWWWCGGEMRDSETIMRLNAPLIGAICLLHPPQCAEGTFLLI